MANEASFSSSLSIRKDSGTKTLISYANSAAFQADVAGTLGPTPGAFTATTDGTDVDLDQVTTPGPCWLRNMDATNYVTVGRWDPTGGGTFYPMLELLPGMAYPVYLSRSLKEEFAGTGTGTGAAATTLRVKASVAPCVVSVEAFER